MRVQKLPFMNSEETMCTGALTSHSFETTLVKQCQTNWEFLLGLHALFYLGFPVEKTIWSLEKRKANFKRQKKLDFWTLTAKPDRKFTLSLSVVNFSLLLRTILIIQWRKRLLNWVGLNNGFYTCRFAIANRMYFYWRRKRLSARKGFLFWTQKKRDTARLSPSNQIVIVLKQLL